MNLHETSDERSDWVEVMNRRYWVSGFVAEKTGKIAEKVGLIAEKNKF